MRIRGILAFGLLAALAVGSARAQDAAPDVRYWPLREINFPVPVDKIQAMNPRPSKLRLWAAADRGRFKVAAERSPGDLDPIDSDKSRRGFRFASPSDGEYDFALQFVYADGEATPRDDALAAQYRIVFDTRPPAVRLTASGTSVEWAVDDENLGPDAVTLEVRWQTRDAVPQKWTAVKPREFRSKDSYTWSGLPANQVLEVRIVAKDRAGLESASRPVSLPAAGLGNTVGGPADPFPARTSDRAGFDDARPSIDYVNTRNLTVESKLTRVTRSGVKAAHLWVKDDKAGWRKDKEVPVNIGPTSNDTTVRIPYAAQKDGLYGFIVIPVNGAGGKQEDPRPGDGPQILVEVDTEIPHVKVKNVRVSPGGAVGPKVEIEWEAVDKNLMPDPIVLEYAEDRTSAEWKPIAAKIPNTGRYVWEVEDKNVWKFYVRAKAVDKASNQGEHVYEKEVLVDLDKPAAAIERVHGGGGGGSRPAPSPYQSERPSTIPPQSVPSSPPPAALPTIPSGDLVAPPVLK